MLSANFKNKNIQNLPGLAVNIWVTHRNEPAHRFWMSSDMQKNRGASERHLYIRGAASVTQLSSDGSFHAEEETYEGGGGTTPRRTLALAVKKCGLKKKGGIPVEPQLPAVRNYASIKWHSTMLSIWIPWHVTAKQCVQDNLVTQVYMLASIKQSGNSWERYSTPITKVFTLL